MKPLFSVLLLITAFASATAAPQTREELQKSLNEQVFSAPFDPGDVEKAEAYSEESKKKGVSPVGSPPAYWLPGWTCASVAGYAYYNYYDYRNCVYYHYYYGRYW